MNARQLISDAESKLAAMDPTGWDYQQLRAAADRLLILISSENPDDAEVQAAMTALAQALIGILPVLLYGILYLYRILYAPPEKRWEDFYGFNRKGKWQISFAAMAAGTFLVCMALMALQNA